MDLAVLLVADVAVAGLFTGMGLDFIRQAPYMGLPGQIGVGTILFLLACLWVELAYMTITDIRS